MRVRTIAALGCLVALAACERSTIFAQESSDTLTRAVIDQWTTEISNWGRWGEDDQLGTLNLITPVKRRQAAALVSEGITVSLASDLSKEENVNNPYPLEHTLFTGEEGGAGYAMDTYTIRYHGLIHSHVDALCHIFHQGRMYNGYSQALAKPTGCEKLGVDRMKDGIFTRGVLVDLPRLKGVRYLEPGTAIMAEDLEAWEQRTGLRIVRGDVLLVRTGRWEREREAGVWDFSQNASGLHASVARWLKERDVAAIGSDGTNDVFPSGVHGSRFPIHQLAIVGLGMPLFDNLDLEAVATEAAARDRWEFLFVAAPLRVAGGTGSPLNPLATF